jgi:DNA repair protein RecO (recombination protein O)
VKDSRKVSDFDVENWRPGLRELFDRTMAADALAETVLATHGGGGGWGTALKLTGEAFDSLEQADEKLCIRIVLHFLWAWTEFLGNKPDLSHCVSCACEVSGDGVSWYEAGEGSLYCDKCRPDSGICVGSGARRWLLAIQNLGSRESLRYNLDNSSLRQARALVLGILTEALGRHLPLWDEF